MHNASGRFFVTEVTPRTKTISVAIGVTLANAITVTVSIVVTLGFAIINAQRNVDLHAIDRTEPCADVHSRSEPNSNARPHSDSDFGRDADTFIGRRKPNPVAVRLSR